MSELIVVGVDGSAEAELALAQAAQEAARRGAKLRVVSVARMPEYWAMPYGMAPPSVSTTPMDFPSIAQEIAQRAVDALAAEHPGFARQIEMEVVGLSGHPATELVEQSRDAELLVLGHRGRGALASAFMGSTGLNCVVHAHCPVLIVRPTEKAEQAKAPVAAAAPAV